MRIVLVIFGYVSVMIMPLIAGQMVRNQGVKLHRVLVGLYNTMTIGKTFFCMPNAYVYTLDYFKRGLNI